MISPEQYQSARILIVDDEIANVALLEVILEQQDYVNIRSTTDAREAVAIYEEFNPDLVLLDIQMPHMDGFQVLEGFKKLERTCAPVMVLTADQDFDVRIRALTQGAKDFLTKPLVPMEVMRRITNLLESRLMHNELNEQNEILEATVRARTAELSNTRLEIVHRLGKAGEYRDNETGNHVIRIGCFSACIGKALGLNASECELLRNASPMHDIGKIGIPDSILLKRAPLTDDEWGVMRKHTLYGAEIFSGNESPLIKTAHIVALQHHEKWDGSGYPNSLKEEEISLEARIVSICDVFDALTSVRPYKEAWDLGDTLDFMKKNKGSHFDPAVYEKFLSVLPEILEIKNALNDGGKEISISPEYEKTYSMA
ncbi:MAG: response regulator [Candidatus Nitrohelix vancouverensis]|uniref:Response regulator n=1 Tax=Candidatus Nitrohelix vancouverensis TaxID=2705534 RepID=A0A7T0C445_9BACT|nr:MAG: response regulator [Candidatus Nitrohelix vancouverensis]